MRANDIEELWQEVERRIEIPGGSGVALEGSIAERLENPSSDIDFVVIAKDELDFPVIPTILFIGQFRVEVRTRTATEMTRQLMLLANAATGGRSAIAQLDEEDLDRCQRFTRAIVVRDEELISRVRQHLPEAVLYEVIADWFLEQARNSLHCALALEALGTIPSAVSWAQSALTEAAKSWLARRGDAYLPKKWLAEQLARTAPGHELTRDILVLETLPRARLEPIEYLNQVFDLLRRLSLPKQDFDKRRLYLAKAKGVTTWQIGQRVHLLRKRSELFALNADAGAAWRSLRFGPRLVALMDDWGQHRTERAALISRLSAIGLVDLCWRGAGRIARRHRTICPPHFHLPILSPEGMITDRGSSPVVLCSLPPARFAAAGMSLVYVNMVIENAREDALGAMQAGQWRVFERSAKRMLRFACLGMMCSYGVHPLPPVEEIYETLAGAGWAPEDLRDRILEYEQSLLADDGNTASFALSLLDEIVSDLRKLTEGSIFPSSFVSPAGWQETLNIGFDWARLGAFLDAQFPLEQARDLIRSAKTHKPPPEAGGLDRTAA
jgi:hypothetical protein